MQGEIVVLVHCLRFPSRAERPAVAPVAGSDLGSGHWAVEVRGDGTAVPDVSIIWPGTHTDAGLRIIA